jgi:mannose/fructose/N-acetylgalactosamine-specific phosphotransferase system component IIC
MGAMPIPSCSKFARGYKFNKTHVSSHWKAADHKRHNFKGSFTVTYLVPVSIGSLSIVIIYLLTKFQKGQSLYSQRAWTMAWLTVGIASGGMVNMMTRALVPNQLKKHSNWHFLWRYLGFILGFGIFLVPAIGGFVTVGQMLMEYGDCHRLGD